MIKTKITILLLTITLCISVFSCQNTDNFQKTKPKDKEVSEDLPTEPIDSIVPPVVITNKWKDNPYKLNVIYFVPKDVDTIFDYKNRISRILLNLQEFYAEGIRNYSHQDRSFGLNLLSDTQVDIITLHSEMTKSEGVIAYQRAMREIDEYFSYNQDKKTSDHTLVIMPSFHEDPKNPGGPPFFGVGRFCFALDYPDMGIHNLGKDDIDGNLATKWIGGLAHELGHGLNAPHNKEHKTEKPEYGTALMGIGNYTYGKEKTYLTHSSSALFSTCQVFASENEERNDWYKNVDHNLIQLKGEYKNNAIVISGKYFSSLPVRVINVYHDREPYGGNDDYDALSWTTKPANNNSFYVECPLEDFYDLDGKYELKIDFYHQNGTKKGYKFYYEFDNNQIPIIEMINTKNIKDRSNWEVIEADSEQKIENPKENILDGNIESAWHTKWKGGEDPLPHHFVVDMKTMQEIEGFGFANRSNLNGAPKKIEIFKSSDNKHWTSLGNFVLETQREWQYIDLPKTENMRYVKVKITSTNGDFKYTHLGEFVAY